jgi:hypothetical protein
MPHIQIKIQRPVAFPDKFLGAPIFPALTVFIVCMFGMTVLFAIKSLAMWGVVLLILYPFLHGCVMYFGTKEPHLTTLMLAYHLTTKAPRTLGNGNIKKHIFHAG